MTITEFLAARYDEEEAQFDAAAEAEAESCRNDGIPDLPRYTPTIRITERSGSREP